jgi:hypothetical protein
MMASLTSLSVSPRNMRNADRFEEEPHVNPSTQTREFSLRDPDGYYVTISALSAVRVRK